MRPIEVTEASPLDGVPGASAVAAAPLAVSVVVPTYRRPDYLERCLTALAAQDLPPTAYEVLIVDDAASPATRAQVLRWAERFPVLLRYLPMGDRHGPAAARNAGWQAAHAGIVAFTDDDCVPDPDWLRQGLAGFEQETAAVWGSIHMPLPKQPTDYERNEAGLEMAEFVTANCFIRRQALAAVGGFDERFTMAWREDADLYFTLLETGRAIKHVPAARVLHPLRPGRWGICLRQQRKSMFNALLYKKHPRLYRQKIQPAVPSHYYVSVLSLLTALSATPAGLPALAVPATALWLGLALRFSLRRLQHTSHDWGHIAEMLLTSMLIPPLSVYWRLRGALRFRVLFL